MYATKEKLHKYMRCVTKYEKNIEGIEQHRNYRNVQEDIEIYENITDVQQIYEETSTHLKNYRKV